MNKLGGIYWCVVVLLTLGACAENPTIQEASSGAMLTLGPEETGISFTNQLSDNLERNIIEYLYYYNGGGVAVGDINNDGLEDLFFTANEQPDKLYLNKGALQFEDISDQAGILPDDAWSTGVTMVDVNNDGYLDIHVCKVGVGIMPAAHNLLYINQQDGTFKEDSKNYGLNIQGFSTQACFLDYDQDGDLDLYLLNHNVHSVRSYGTIKKRKEDAPWAGDQFLENRINEAEGKFVDVTKETGIYSSPLGYGLAIAAADLNGDGLTDIYVGNDFHENDYIYLNNGDKTFREVIKDWTDHTTQFSMGVDIADLNNDQLPDIFSTDMLPFDEEIYLKSGGEDTDQLKKIKSDLGFEEQYARNHLQLNSGHGYFTDLALQTRTFATDWSWGVLMQDFDNNGRKDIFISNGIVKRPNDLDYINYLNSEAISKLDEDDPERTRKLIEKLPSEPLHNILFLQGDEMRFSSLEESKVGPPTFSNGVAYADLDKDGTLEVIVNNINAPAHILTLGEKDKTGNFLNIKLKDDKQNTVLGTKVYVYTKNQDHYQELQVVKGYQSSSSYTLHFGLGAVSQVDSVRIIWPDLSQQLLSGVSANQELEVVKPSEKTDQVQSAAIAIPAFEVFSLLHEENAYEDFDQEKLMPSMLSREGPAVLFEDLNEDGIKDLLIGGAHGFPMRLLKGKSNGAFENLQIEDFIRDAQYEDADFATIDFDKDGDLDLYAVSGGGAAKELDKALEDRLYLNNGNMDFRRVPLSLPHTNGSVAAVADFNNDGYEDIFVGARSIPGSYGLSPYSFVLTNKSGQGVDIAYKHRFGMVSDAQWADIDQDNDLDLVICGDWMPVTILENDGQGALEYLSEEAGAPDLTGLWTTLAIADVNKDGQLDIFAGNLGTNSLMQASKENPVQLYLGDFDENGFVDPLVFFQYFDRYIPLGSKDKLLSQLPGLKKDFVAYAKYAEVAGFDGLLPSGRPLIVEEKSAESMASNLFLSRPDGGYDALPLQGAIQWGTVQDMWFDESSEQLYYITSNAELSAVHGSSQSARGGTIGSFDPENQEFKSLEQIELPRGVQARALVPVAQNQLLLVTNNNYPYLLEQR